jgi:hypothetical protein
MMVRNITIFHHRLVVRGNSQLVAEFIARSRAVSVNDGAGEIPLSLNAHIPQPGDASQVQRDVQEIVYQFKKNLTDELGGDPGRLVLEVSPWPGTLPSFHVSGLPSRDQEQAVLEMPERAWNSLRGLFTYAMQERMGYTPAEIWRTFRWGTDHDAIFGTGEFGELVRRDTPSGPRGEHDYGWVVHRRHLASIGFKTIKGPIEPWLPEVAQGNPGLEFSLVWADVSAGKAAVLVARQGKLDGRTEMKASDVLSAEETWF